MLDAAINEGLQVLLCVEDEVRNELRQLVVDESHGLSNSRDWIIDELQKVQELLTDHIHYILRLGPVDDGSKSNH